MASRVPLWGGDRLMKMEEATPAPAREGAAGSRTRRSSAVRLSALLRLWSGRARPDDVLAESAPDEVVLQRDALYRRLLAVADLASVAASVTVAVVLVGGNSLTLVSLAMAPLVLLAIKTIGLYDRDHHLLHKSTLDEAPRALPVRDGLLAAVLARRPLCRTVCSGVTRSLSCGCCSSR